ncbi:MAG: phage tail protein [Brevundimonas sp.]|jgi:phage tail-like protein
MLDETVTAVGVLYLVTLDGQNLGAFSSCDGLGVEVVLETREEGGNNDAVWQLPTRLKYPNIKLSRPLGADTDKVVSWFQGVTGGYERRTGTIQAMATNGKVIATWNLRDIVPVRWSGSSMSPDNPKVVTETVEFAHHGFTAEGKRS